MTCSLHAWPIEHTLHVGRDVNASRLDWSQDKQFGLSLSVDAERFGSVLGRILVSTVTQGLKIWV